MVLYFRNPDIYDASLDNEICIFNPINSHYLTLNETASFLWEILENPLDITQIQNLILDNYNADNFNLKDLKTFLDEAVKNKILMTK